MRNSSRWHILINGTVQGVGFRPFIYRLATEMDLSGHVFNHSEGVTIEAQGDAGTLDRFVSRIRNEIPPLACIHNIETKEIPPGSEDGFSIVESRDTSRASTLISPDIAPCDDCLREMMNIDDRRHGYPLINCTNCGPRYSIIQKLPYDRPMTTMNVFEMCENCQSEYTNPLDRRFHAQPNACGECGPGLRFVEITPSLCKGGLGRVDHGSENLPLPASPYKGEENIKKTIHFLDSGHIVAIKGLGGYHIACDATNDDAVKRLRERKHRDEKPFAVMVGDIESARSLCHVSEDEEKLLTSPQRPIVLLRKLDGAKISDLVAPGNKNLGVMLPSTPLHQLLFNSEAGSRKQEAGSSVNFNESRITNHESRVLVMTSGNITDEPIVFKDDTAILKLSKIADAFLIHDREIHIRIDDSITRVMNGKPLILRRARGYTPTPVRLNFDMPQILATGADLKNAICLTKGKNAFLSQHLGDMENLDANNSLEMVTNHLMDILDIKPEVIAYDAHPDYFSSRFALRATSDQRRATVVQHHHAHIASCMAENDLPDEKVIGIALDGTGYGTDGTVWGGEILIADYRNFERVAHFAQVPMPGGDVAAKETWRMAVAYLSSPVASRRSPVNIKGIPEDKIELIQEMIEKDINCPKTSSCGRLFDAVAALIGLRMKNSFEGQAAMELEQLADETETGKYDYSIGRQETGDWRLILDFSPTISAICRDVETGTDRSIISMRFHNTIIAALADICLRIDAGRTTQDARRVCLSGGCFQNAILTTNLEKKLVDKGFTVYTHSLVPPNDGGVALGQAAIAAHRHGGKQ